MPLDMGCTDLGAIRIAGHAAFACSSADSRAVAALSFGSVAVQLHKLGIVHIVIKGFLNGFQISLVTISGKLNPVCQP